MLIFHEGLPGSGKSYETLVEHIVPSLKKGRKVYARINGLNHQKIAELADIDLETCQRLLVEIPEEEVHHIPKLVTNDSLVVIDELQNFFPSGRAKVADDMTQFVTEHRHRGLDIIAMGQSIADCHNLWRRRTQRKIQFLKMDMIGQEGRYKWTTYQGTLDAKGEITFKKIQSGIKKYDTKYFGSYASHQASTDNLDNYQDKRLNIFNTAGFKYGVPAFLLMFGYAIYYLVGFFNGDEALVKEENTKNAQSATINQARSQLKQDLPNQTKEPGTSTIITRTETDFVMINESRYIAQLTYINRYKSMIWDMLVVWVDDTDHTKDQVYRDDLLAMGYTLKWVGYGVEAKKGEFKTVFRFRPAYDPIGRVANNTSQQLVSEQ
jgi:zona occludens toxin